MKYIRDILLIVIAVILMALLIKTCEKKVFNPIEISKAEDSLQAKLKQIDTINIHDTINRYNEITRHSIDTVYQRLQAGNTINDICSVLGFKDTGLDCKRLVVQWYYNGKRDSILLVRYEALRISDSTRISIYRALDSIKSERIGNLISQNEKMQQKAEKRAKRAKWIHALSAAGVIYILLR